MEKKCAIIIIFLISVLCLLFKSFLLNIGKIFVLFFVLVSVLFGLFYFFSAKYRKRNVLFLFKFLFCFQFISFLLNTRKEMSNFFCFYFHVLYFTVLVSFFFNIGQKTKPRKQTK